jgi:3-isopropylmalate/(R)-2-methylmalate dehydratase large subunit
MTSQTLVEKIRDAHLVLHEDGMDLLAVDRHYLHEGSHHAFARLAEMDLRVRRPDLTFGVADHYVPTSGAPATDVIAGMIDKLDRNGAAHGVRVFGRGDARQGIVHVAMPEQGLTLPGSIIVCGDSHTATHGALGAWAFGIGASEVAHVLATQTLWQAPPKPMRITVTGQLADGVTAKDLSLHIIATIGTCGAAGHAVEYAGDAITALGIEARMTLCNMTIEMGARAGIVPPDAATAQWLLDRPYAPKGTLRAQAEADWALLVSDPGAQYAREVSIDAADVAPMVTWGTSPDEAVAITGSVPTQPEGAASRAYMGLEGGQPIEGLAVDMVFIGSCTNARLSDLQEAARVLNGRRTRVPLLISPGSTAIAQEAERAGLADVFRAAGAQWGASGCSLCVGMNGDLVKPGARCASTSNRNFRGRQGPGARTHLMSPAMAAAAALTGQITDVRRLDAEVRP